MKNLLTLIFTISCLACNAQIYDTNNVAVQTLAGSGFAGYVDGDGQQTMFNFPISICADSSGNIFVFDYYNLRIRKISSNGTVSTFVGGGGSAIPGYGTNVALPASVVMTIDHNNTLFLMEYPSGTSMLRITTDGYVSEVHLPGLIGGQEHDGMCVDSANNVYIADFSGNKIYRYKTNNVLEVFAGSGNAGSVDGNGIFTSFSNPSSMACDPADNIYVWDSGGRLIRKINQGRDVVTIAGHQGNTDSDGHGTNASFYLISAMCCDRVGNIYLSAFSVTGGESVRKLSVTLDVTTLAGSFTQNGFTNGPGFLARFDGAGDEGICIAGGNILISDTVNERIRQITFNAQPQVVSGANLSIGMFAGVTINGTVGRTYQIQSSSDLSNWSDSATVLLNQNPFLWIDQSSTSPNKFYRAAMLP